MARLFISYSRDDEPFARLLARSLSDHGASIWIDVDEIPAGMKWSRAIQQGLDNCDALILIISPKSMDSENVEDEWQYFLDQRKPVFPVLYRPAKIHFQLSRLQYVDFHSQEHAAAFPQLISELRRRGILVGDAGLSAPNVELPAQRPLEVETDSRMEPLRSPRGRGGLVWGIALATLLILGGIAIAVLSAQNPADQSALNTPASQVLTPGDGPSGLVASSTTSGSPISTQTSIPAVISATDVYLTDQAAVEIAETQIFLTEFAPTFAVMTATAESWTATPSPIYRETAYARMTETRSVMETASAGTATRIALISPTPQATLTPSNLVCDDSPPSRLNVGMRAFVTISPEGAERQNLMVRAEPAGAEVGRLPEGTPLYITGSGQCQSGLLWWPIQTADGSVSGWSAEGMIDAEPNEYFIVPAGG